MQRVKLTRNERMVLRLLNAGLDCPPSFPQHKYIAGCIGLEKIGFAQCMWATGHELVAADITTEGETYLALNPQLRNPINWKWLIGTALAAASLAISIIAFLIACKALNQ